MLDIDDFDIEESIRSTIERNNVVGIKMELERFIYSFYDEIIDLYQRDALDKKMIKRLEGVLQALDYVYINGEQSPLSDSKYDELHAIYNEKTGKFITNKFETGRVKVKHVYPELKGTIAKCHYVTEGDKSTSSIKTHRSIETWLKNCLSQLPGGRSYEIGFYLKFDGVSVVLAVKEGKVISAITRGDADTGEGMDVTPLFAKHTFEIHPEEYGLKAEMVVPKKEFLEFKKLFPRNDRKLSDPRSVASGLVNSAPTSFTWDYLQMMILQLYMYGEYTYPQKYPYGFEAEIMRVDRNFDIEVIRGIIKNFKKIIDDYPVACDGVVIRFTEPDAIHTLGRDEDKGVNKFEVAFKFPPEEKTSKIIDVEFQIGLLGSVTPVAKIEPVKMHGRTIKSVSLGSIDRYRSLNLHKGERVKVKYEIIPYLDRCEEQPDGYGEHIPIPSICPVCHSELVESPILMCVNPDCPSRVMGRIENYCSKMDIANLGESTIETFFNMGILTCIEDLYRLKDHKKEIVELDGFGEKSFAKLIKAIDNAKVEVATLLGSLGIKSIGRKKFKKILSIYYVDELLSDDMTIEKLCKVPGIQVATATKIMDGLQSNIETIRFLMKRVRLKDSKKKKEVKGTVVLTGFRNSKFETYLEDLGYEIGSSVTKNTSLLITKDATSVSEKTKKAEALGIRRIDAMTAYDEFNFVP